jgi:fluoride exporter
VNTLLLVAAGGALGSVARHSLSLMVARHWSGTLPLGILLVNVLGCLLMGIFTALFLKIGAFGENARLLLAAGFLGGFTTFSSFALDALKLTQAGQSGVAVVYVLASVVFSLVAVFAGFAVARIFV